MRLHAVNPVFNRQFETAFESFHFTLYAALASASGFSDIVAVDVEFGFSLRIDLLIAFLLLGVIIWIGRSAWGLRTSCSALLVSCTACSTGLERRFAETASLGGCFGYYTALGRCTCRAVALGRLARGRWRRHQGLNTIRTQHWAGSRKRTRRGELRRAL